MKTITLKSGAVLPRLGQGTWMMGDDPAARKDEIAALRRGIDLGMTLLDTAEMYGSGRSETLVGEAIGPYAREKLFIVSKVLPHNAGQRDIFKSCEGSLHRLGTDYLDCYLLHWRGGVPLRETVDCMLELVALGKIKSYGVSNLDTADMLELARLPGGDACVVDQALYHLGSRGVEYDLLPLLKKQRIAMMAYCPLAQGGALRRGLAESRSVQTLAREKGVDPFQILLAFVLADENVVAIPKAASIKHAEQNAAALSIELSAADMALLAEDFPPPARKLPLDIQ